MNRLLLLLVLFLILGGGVFWYFSGQQEDKTTMLSYERNFAVEDTDKIHKIFIADREGAKTTLERKEDYWLYNGKYPARPNAIENLLDAISRVQMKYKPPQAAEEGMIKNLSTQGIKVEIYDKNDELIKAYYVGGATNNERGTYMIMEDADNPFVAEIPGWTGNLRFRYNLKGDDWRDKAVFSYEPEEIQSVSIEYPKQKNKSFKLERVGGEFNVEPFYDITPKINRPVQQGNVEAFLLGFERLVAEAFENENTKRDSLNQLVPFCIISVKDMEGNERVVKLIPIITGDLGIDKKTGEMITNNDIERYFADCSCGDFFLVQHRVFRKILWGYDFFFEDRSS